MKLYHIMFILIHQPKTVGFVPKCNYSNLTYKMICKRENKYLKQVKLKH